MKKIRLHSVHMNRIKDELDVSMQTIRMSLYYVYDSETAKKVRSRAKELLIEEATAITI